jgi:signal transduction histidine kinase
VENKMTKKDLSILIVEDNPTDLALLQLKLMDFQTMSLTPSSAGTIKEAIEQTNQTHFDIILLDLGLPDSDGTETIKTMREHAKETPIVVLSANSAVDMEVNAIKSGVQDYIVKGRYEPYILERVIRNAIFRNEIKTKLLVKNERLVQLMTVEEEYVNMISHEIKNPLTIIEGTLYMLQGNPQVSLEGEGEQMIEDITGQVSRLYKLVESILDLSRIEHGCMPVSKTEFDLKALLKEIIRFIKPQYPGEIELHIDNAVPIKCVLDKEKATIILHNLIHNGTKFTDSTNGRIQVSVSIRSVKDQSQLLLAVKDNGPGISKADIPNLFKRFCKLTKKAGTGLGLTIAKKLSWLMGGNISVDSDVGVGTTFTVSLPIVRDKPVIHIISPDNNCISNVQNILKGTSIKSYSTKIGSQAIKKAIELQPDFILLDEVQVESSFFTIYNDLKDIEGIDTIPIVLCRHEEESATNLSGAQEIMLPIKSEELETLLRSYALIDPVNG